MLWLQKILYVNLILTSLLLWRANGQGPLADAGKKLITPIQDNIKKLIDANRRDMVSLLERIGMKPDQLMKNVFPGISRFNITQLKYCYDMSMDGEEYNLFENTFMGTVHKYYNHFTDNWDAKKFPAKIQSLYDSMKNIYTHALECATNSSNYQLGFTQLSDYSDDEYRRLLGERASDRIEDEYERRPIGADQPNDDDGYQNQSNNNNNNDRNHNSNNNRDRDNNNNNSNSNRRGNNQSPINLNTDKTISVPTSNDRINQGDLHNDRYPNNDNNRRGGQNNQNNRPNNDRFNEDDRNPPRRGENDRDDNRNRGNPNRGGNDRDDNRNRGNPNRGGNDRDDNRNRGNPNRGGNDRDDNRNRNQAENNRNFDREQNRNQNRLTEDRDSQRRGDNNRNDFINQNERRQDDRRIINNNNNFDSGNIVRQPILNPDINRGQSPRRDENLGFNNDRNFGNNQGLNQGLNQGGGLGRFKRANNGVPKKCKPKRQEPLPKKWNWRARGKVTPAKYQGSCGSCWTFTALAALESAMIIKDPKHDANVDLSEQELLSCARAKGCSGGTAVDAYNYMLKDSKGVTDESTWPYDEKEDNCDSRKRGKRVARIKDYCLRGKYAKVNGKPEQLDDEEIMYIIKEFGPVYATINADDLGMKNLKNGVYKYKKCPKQTNHAITIVGWDQESWIIKNSWGRKWGDEGFFRMKRGENLCGINTYVMFPLV